MAHKNQTLLNREDMILLLKSIDSRLNSSATIVICGAAAGILAHNWERPTVDIDVLGSKPTVSEMSGILKQVAKDQRLGEDFVNDGPKGFSRYLTEDFKSRLLEIKGDFKNLNVYCLSKADLFVMKLASFRQQDLEDLSRMDLNINEREIVARSIDKISTFDPKTSMRMQYFLEEQNNERSCNPEMEKGRDCIPGPSGGRER